MAVVDLEVVVTDLAGRPVADLTKEDFRVFVGGQQAEILDLSASFAGPSSSRSRGASGEVPPSVSATGVVSGWDGPRVWLVFVDMLRTGEARRIAALRAIRKLLNTSLRDGDYVMAAYFDGAALRVALPPSLDRRKADQTIRSLSFRAAPSRLDLVGFAIDEEERARLESSAMRSLRDFITMGSGLPGRGLLLLVGGGYQLDGWPSPDIAGRLQREYEQVRDALATSNITLDSVWAWKSDRATGADMPSAIEPAMDGPAPGSAPMNSGSTLATLASDSGGRTFVASPDLDLRIAKAESEAEHYYLLSIRPPTATTSASRSQVVVKVAHSGIRVRYRHLIRHTSETEDHRRASLTSLLMDECANPWGLRVRVGPVQRKSSHSFRAPIEINIPFAAISFRHDHDRYTARLEINLSARDAAGHYTSIDPKELALDVGPGELVVLQTHGVRYSLQLLVSRGTTDAAVTVADLDTREQSTTSVKINAGRY